MRTVLCLFAMLATCFAGDNKPTITNQAGNERVNIFATPLLSEEDIRAALDADLPKGVVAVQVKIVPLGEKPLSISRDDFTLLSHKDGQRSGAFEPSQIAGSATLVVSRTSDGGIMLGQPTGPVWGGAPGTGGRPMAGPSSGIGGGSAGAETAEASVQHDKKPENPLLKIWPTRCSRTKRACNP